MTLDEKKRERFLQYFKDNGVVIPTSTGLWVRTHFEPLFELFKFETKAAYESGYNKAKEEGVVGDVSGQNRPRDSELKGRTGETRKPKTRSPRKRSGGDRPANSGSGY